MRLTNALPRVSLTVFVSERLQEYEGRDDELAELAKREGISTRLAAKVMITRQRNSKKGLSRQEADRVAAELLSGEDVEIQGGDGVHTAGTSDVRGKLIRKSWTKVVRSMRREADSYGGGIPYDHLDAAIRRIYPLPNGVEYADVWQICFDESLAMTERQTEQHYREKRLVKQRR